MTVPRLVPFRPTPADAAPLLTDDFTAWASSGDWVISGDDVIKDGWGGTDRLGYANQQLFYWDNNPGSPQEPFYRSTAITKTYTGLPANTLVVVTVQASWRLGRWDTEFIGMRINGSAVAPNSEPTGTLTAPFVAMSGTGITNEDGELEIAFVFENAHPSFNENIDFDELVITRLAAELADIIYDAGVVKISGNDLSITRGGVSFDEQAEFEEFDFPGKSAPMEGCDAFVRMRPVIRTRAMLTGEYQMQVYRPGGAWQDGTAVAGERVYNIPAARVSLGAGITLTDVVALWPRARGDYFGIRFAKGVCTKWAVGSQDKDEGELPIEIGARIPQGQPINTVPFEVFTIPANSTTVP